MNELTKYRLGDIAVLGSGATPKSTVQEYYLGGDIPWINSGELSEPYITSPKKYITKLGFDNSSVKLYPKDTILLAMYGATAGKASLLCFEACTNQAICAIQPNKDILNPLYLKYKLDTMYEYLVGLSSGSARDNLSQIGISNLILDLPPIEEQEKVAAILSSLDSKIALNRAINHNLEAMAKQLYDYWFVQFDFPDENGKPYKSNGGEMIYSDALKKYIPKGWTHSPLRVLVDLEDFKRIPLSNAQRAERKGEFPYYGATGIMDYIDDFIFDYDILLLAEDGSTSDSNGFPVVQYVWGEVWVNNHAHIILPKDRAHLIYTYFLLKSIPVKMIETGSIQKKISQENLLRYKVINVPKQLRDIYTECIKPMWEQKKLATEEIIQLTKLRDELLPLLMNGQVSVNSD